MIKAGLIKKLNYKFPVISHIYKLFRDNRKSSKEPAMTPLGFKLIGNEQMEKGVFEPAETKIISKFLNHVTIFIDVGANIGYYCCIALKKNIHTIAIEPHTVNLKYLYKNISANNWQDNTEIFPLALSDKNGLLKLFGSGTGASLVRGWSGNTERFSSYVPVLTFDKLFAKRFKEKNVLILVDIEGAEYLMLQGANEFLNRSPKPIWIVEISITEHQPKGVEINPKLKETFKVFWDAGYKAIVADKTLREVSEDDLEKIIKGETNLIKSHNFIFYDSSTDINLLLQ